MAKSIDKRMSELGGTRIMEVKCADEATDMEEIVEAWKISIVPVVQGVITGADGKNNTDEKEKSGSSEAAVESKANEGEEANNTKAIKTEVVETIGIVPTGCPPGIQPLSQIAASLGLEESVALAAPCDPAKLPKMKIFAEKVPSYTVQPQPQAKETAPATLNPNSNSNPNPNPKSNYVEGKLWSQDEPYQAEVRSARWLTTSSSNHVISSKGTLVVV